MMSKQINEGISLGGVVITRAVLEDLKEKMGVIFNEESEELEEQFRETLFEDKGDYCHDEDLDYFWTYEDMTVVCSLEHGDNRFASGYITDYIKVEELDSYFAEDNVNNYHHRGYIGDAGEFIEYFLDNYICSYLENHYDSLTNNKKAEIIRQKLDWNDTKDACYKATEIYLERLEVFQYDGVILEDIAITNAVLEDLEIKVGKQFNEETYSKELLVEFRDYLIEHQDDYEKDVNFNYCWTQEDVTLVCTLGKNMKYSDVIDVDSFPFFFGKDEEDNFVVCEDFFEDCLDMCNSTLEATSPSKEWFEKLQNITWHTTKYGCYSKCQKAINDYLVFENNGILLDDIKVTKSVLVRLESVYSSVIRNYYRGFEPSTYSLEHAVKLKNIAIEYKNEVINENLLGEVPVVFNTDSKYFWLKDEETLVCNLRTNNLGNFDFLKVASLNCYFIKDEEYNYIYCGEIGDASKFFETYLKSEKYDTSEILEKIVWNDKSDECYKVSQKLVIKNNSEK